MPHSSASMSSAKHQVFAHTWYVGNCFCISRFKSLKKIYAQPKCKRLWCTTTLDEKEGCRTQHMPWADGTPCDKNRWCLRGECEPKNRSLLQRIDGKWGPWQP